MSRKKKVCGDCRFWHRMEPQRRPIGLGAVEIGQQAVELGQCRACPPVPIVAGFQPSREGPLPQILTVYPGPAADMAACAVFERRGSAAEQFREEIEGD